MSTVPSALDKVVASVKASAVNQPLSTTERVSEVINNQLLAEQLALAVDNRNLRKKIAFWVGIGLAVEIVLLFCLVISQGLARVPFTLSPFSLEKWTFSVFTSAVLLQTFSLAPSS